MSESSSLELNGGQLQDFTIDQLAGASALILGSLAFAIGKTFGEVA